MRKIFLILFGVQALLFPVAAQQPEAAFSKKQILIGEQTYLTFTINPADLAGGKKVVWPRMKDTVNKFIEILDSVVDVNDPKKGFSKKYLVTSFDSGSYTIQPFTFLFDAQPAQTNALILEVGTVAVDTTKDIKDIKEIRAVSYAEGGGADVPFYKQLWFYMVVALALAGIVVFFVIRKRRKAKAGQETKPEIILPLHEQLLLDLDALDSKQLWQNNQVKLYYVELTDLLRTYVEKRYKVMAHEQTTVQLVNNLKTSGIYPEALQLLKSLLELADMVKFAKAQPTTYENQALMDNARNFAVLTKPSEEVKLG